jgi:hypothetical protein
MKCIRNVAYTYLVEFLDAIPILIPEILLIIILNLDFLISSVLFFKVSAAIHCDMEGTTSPGRNGYSCVNFNVFVPSYVLVFRGLCFHTAFLSVSCVRLYSTYLTCALHVYVLYLTTLLDEAAKLLTISAVAEM